MNLLIKVKINIYNIWKPGNGFRTASLFRDLTSGRVTYQLQASARNALKASRYIEPRLRHTYITAVYKPTQVHRNRVILYCKLSSPDHTDVGHWIQCSIHIGLTIRMDSRRKRYKEQILKYPPNTEGLYDFLLSKSSHTNIAALLVFYLNEAFWRRVFGNMPKARFSSSGMGMKRY